MRLKGFESLKNLKIGKSKEKPDVETAEAGDTPSAQEAGLEEQLNHRTQDLVATEQQLKELSSTMNASEKDEETPPQPHGPLSELTVGPEDEQMDEEIDASALLGEAEEEVKIVEVGAGAAAPAEAEKEPAEELAKEEESDSFNSLFSQEEEEENPLAALINSLPDVTAQELLYDLQEIKEIMQERHQD
jgi:hypothetical protein